MTAAELKAALADCTHVKIWAVNMERGCMEVVHSIFHKDGTEVASQTHNYLDDIQPPALDPRAGLTQTNEEHDATLQHLETELSSYTPSQVLTFGAALKARIEELKAAGHPDPVAAATTPVDKAKGAAHDSAMAADVAAANVLVGLSGVTATTKAGDAQ